VAAPAKPAPKSAPKPEKDRSKKAAAEQAQPAPPAPALATEAGSRELDTFLQQAADYMQSKAYPKAVDTLEEALRQHPDEAKLYFQLALAYWYKALQKPDGSRRTTMEKTSYHKAVKAFQTFLERAPNDPLANEARMRLTVLRNAQYGGG
jgi:outer membrane protein assembly factor BamD (BamD/ComL family)